MQIDAEDNPSKHVKTGSREKKREAKMTQNSFVFLQTFKSEASWSSSSSSLSLSSSAAAAFFFVKKLVTCGDFATVSPMSTSATFTTTVSTTTTTTMSTSTISDRYKIDF